MLDADITNDIFDVDILDDDILDDENRSEDDIVNESFADIYDQTANDSHN